MEKFPASFSDGAPDDPMMAWVQEHRREVEARLAAYPATLAKAQSALLKAQDALRNYGGNMKAYETAWKAQSIASRAIEKLQLQRKLDLERMKAFERHQDLRSVPTLTSSDLREEPVLPPAKPLKMGPIMVVGEAQVKTPSGWALVDPSRGFGEGEEVRTGPDGYAELTYPDGSRILLMPNSKYACAGPSRYELFGGSLECKVKHWKDAIDRSGLLKSRYEYHRTLRTTDCACSIRGTSLEMRCNPGSSTQVVVTEGKVEVNTTVQGRTLEVQGGQTVLVLASGEIIGPEPESMADQRWNEGHGPGARSA